MEFGWSSRNSNHLSIEIPPGQIPTIDTHCNHLLPQCRRRWGEWNFRMLACADTAETHSMLREMMIKDLYTLLISLLDVLVLYVSLLLIFLTASHQKKDNDFRILQRFTQKLPPSDWYTTRLPRARQNKFTPQRNASRYHRCHDKCSASNHNNVQ